MNNKSARLYGMRDLRVEHVPIPELGPTDVLVQMAFVGMCRSDVHFYDEGEIDRWVVSRPLTLGHEMSGVISKVGPEVTNVKAGDRVAIDLIRPCFECRYCKKGRRNLCSNSKFAGLPFTDGGFAKYMVTPAYTCHILPDNVSLQEGATMEPLSVAVHALRRGKVEEGDVAVVIGAGPIGLFSMQVAKAFGASKVLVVDINPKRLELATKLGADATFNSAGLNGPKETADAIKQALGDEADLVVECSGAHGTLDTAIHVCSVGGRVVVLGIGEMAMHLHEGMAAIREIDLIGAFANNNCFPECIQLVSSGKVKTLPLISHLLSLDNFVDAIDMVRSGAGSTKVMIDIQK